MLFDYKVFEEQVLEDLKQQYPQLIERAMKRAAFDWVMPEVKAAIAEAFDRPTPYTLNSTKFELSSNGDKPMITIYLREPEGWYDHYLIPQVEGGERNPKGFEKQLSMGWLTPAKGAKLDKYGNIGRGFLRQVLSSTGYSGLGGYSFARTERSGQRNKKQRDYFRIEPYDQGHLHPGVYKRMPLGTKGVRSGSYKSMQRGKRKDKVRSRGIVPVLLASTDPPKYRKRLDFYSYATSSFLTGFASEYEKLISKV